MLTLIIQYLLMPIPFLLTFILPIVFYFISRKYVWFGILLTTVVEIVVNWEYLCYYESRDLMMFFIFLQIVLMTIIILILKAIGKIIRK